MMTKTATATAAIALGVLITAIPLNAAEAQLLPTDPSLKFDITQGQFKPSMESLTAYKCPDWFRDAKFGIWAHWGPQAVPEMGDWYAKRMYMPGDVKYKHHLETYGHSSEHGYKDIIPLWKAEKWDPERLMALYKKAGAKYFVSMGSHHDNFYLWNSKLHKWNVVNMGPKRDVVGDWQKAAQNQGLKFGVSEHLGASFTWFQPSHGCDTNGPKAGVRYDGADPKWQDLYHFPADPDDKGWYSKNPKWHQQWFDRIKELVDNYQPDLLYTDGAVPFHNEVGLSMIAHLYNSSAARHGGKPEFVYNCKQQSEGRWVEDLERGVMPKINPNPWQTDTSIGDWYYNKNWKFRPVSWTIHMLADIVSKNGNLLLNVVQRPDGSLDAEVEQALEELAQWVAIHGEAIYGTRPWQVFGEGRVKARGGHFKEDFAYTAQDIRFTTKGATLYAIALGWPADGKLLVKSLATPAGKINDVRLLGFSGKIDWQQTADGLVVKVPAEKVSPYTCALKISGSDLKPAPFVEVTDPIGPDEKGVLNLRADDADLHGQRIKLESKGSHTWVGFWDKPQEFVTWKVKFTQPGKYKINANVATIHKDIEFVVEVAGKQLVGKAPHTGKWDEWKGVGLGSVEIAQPGEQVVTVRPKDAKAWKAINLRSVRLTRSE